MRRRRPDVPTLAYVPFYARGKRGIDRAGPNGPNE